MARLVLIRHAKAEPPAPGQPDVDRTLSDRGRADATVAADRLGMLELELPIAVLVSPAERTQQTYALMRAGLPAHDRWDVDELYEAAVSTVVDAVDDRLRPADDELAAATIVVIGHNPTMRDLVAHLTGADIPHLPTSAIAVLDSASGDLASGQWSLTSLAVPRAGS